MTEKHEVSDDFHLLNLMELDYQHAPSVYRAGPYWAFKGRRASDEIRRQGIRDFRGEFSRIAESFGDGPGLDARRTLYGTAIRNFYRLILQRLYPFRNTWDRQVAYTRELWSDYVKSEQQRLASSGRVNELMHKWKLNDSLLGGCVSKVTVNDQEISLHYLHLVDTLDRITSSNSFGNSRQPKSFFELGGGFGANTHLVLQNLSSVRKVLYVDIPPNLYVGTQYLRTLYEGSVVDYEKARSEEELRFSDNDDLEILCIAPAQLPKVKSKVDWFHNAHSFVEMPKQSVACYVQHAARLLESTHSLVSMVSYDGFDLETTFHPMELPEFWSHYGFLFRSEEVPTLREGRLNMHFLGVR